MLQKAKYGTTSRPSAKYRIKVGVKPLMTTGRKKQDIDGWKVR